LGEPGNELIEDLPCLTESTDSAIAAQPIGLG
jgi:hypothetical protein